MCPGVALTQCDPVCVPALPHGELLWALSVAAPCWWFSPGRLRCCFAGCWIRSVMDSSGTIQGG